MRFIKQFVLATVVVFLVWEILVQIHPIKISVLAGVMVLLLLDYLDA